jgi:hypothetical protein
MGKEADRDIRADPPMGGGVYFLTNLRFLGGLKAVEGRAQCPELMHPSSPTAFAWTGHNNDNRPTTSNGLNQYTGAGSAAFAYDANGNLTSDNGTIFLYDIENRLVAASGGRTAGLRHDPLGRLLAGTMPPA